MPTRQQDIVFRPQVGWSTDLSENTREFSHWIDAENTVFESSGAARKWGGTSRLNSSALSGTPTVTGFFDYWTAGAAGTMTGTAVIQAGTNVFKMDRSGSVLDGTCDDITGAVTITSGSLPTYTVLNDRVIVTTSAGDAPYTWTQTGNAAALGGTPPAARVCTTHVNRVWMANRNANPSRLYYSASLDPTDWTGADTGNIDIDPNDGDVILGLASYFNRLVIFKGPNFGSIHVITGTSPTGSDAFARRVVMRGVPISSHRSLVPVGNDLWFVTPLGIYALQNTEQYGDHRLVFIGDKIQNFWKNSVNKTRLNQAVGVYYPERGLVVFSLPRSGQTNNDATLLFHPFLQNRVSLVTRGAACLGIAQGASNARILHAGRYSNGFVDLEDRETRELAGSTAYTMKVTTPALTLAQGDRQVALKQMWLRLRPRGGDVSISVSRDNNTAQTLTFSQASSGGLLGTDVLGSFILGGRFQVPNLQLIEGPCRTATVQLTQGSLGGDLELLEFGLRIEGGDARMEA